MKYRVGKKQNRVILDEKGLVVAECLKGEENVAKRICNLLNKHGLEESSEKESYSSGYLPKCSRVEVIDMLGRSYTNYDCKSVEVQMQDEEKALKVFIS